MSPSAAVVSRRPSALPVMLPLRPVPAVASPALSLMELAAVSFPLTEMEPPALTEMDEPAVTSAAWPLGTTPSAPRMTLCAATREMELLAAVVSSLAESVSVMEPPAVKLMDWPAMISVCDGMLAPGATLPVTVMLPPATTSKVVSA